VFVTSKRAAMNDRVTATPASLWLRLLAGIYDLLPLLGLWFLASVLALAITGGALDPHRLAHKLLVQGFVLVFSAAYFVISWTRGGQTLGMRAWRLRVVNRDGDGVRWPLALLRFGTALVSLTAAGIGLVWALFDAEKRAWHDIAAKTLVVRLEKPR
jgi:uncharacterized RDD family membrane protein YckC